MTEQLFVTGAAGYLGQAISQRLSRAGYHVHGLVRSEVSARSVRAQGVTPVIGSLEDIGRFDLSTYDGIIDTATADHAPSTEAFLGALAGTGKTYLRTSGTGVYTDLAAGEFSSNVYTETDAFVPAPVVAARYESDQRVLDAANDDIRSVVIRPAMVFGDGGSEQLPLMLRYGLSTGRTIYAGSGENRWGNVYLYDLAELYLLALEHAKPGASYNVASGELAMSEVTDGIAHVLGQTGAREVSIEEARGELGARWVDVALASNSRVDSSRAKEELGWDPQGPDLLADLMDGSYRRIWASKGDPHDHTAR
ncbi:NAD-dependent epimerase/dehydratase family protein [Promicromonospora panici]|uniref:NAD-dependent epimerase/dehydratase family protein n=1 Tax=Promicromonospora panici TaxID=2219658 RepID=UPI00101BB08A|nr:NAD-dependent epimerase/dehydratase family protein [Promicromonospora panici]